MLMTITELRANIKAGRATVGAWLQLPSPDVAEIIGRSGYDWAAVDLEHGAMTRALLPDLFRALECGGTLPFARVAEATRENIKAALDSGAQGLILPMIESAAQLQEAVAWAQYPPTGCRGVGYCRANAYGRCFTEYLAEAKHIFMVAQIEHINAVHNLKDILAVPGLDAIMVGPYDLSGSMGLTGQLTHPDMLTAMERIAALAKAAGVPMGTHVVMPDQTELAARIQEGYLFLAYGIDAVFLRSAAGCPEY